MTFFLHVFRDIEWVILAILIMVLFGALIFGIVKCLRSKTQFQAHAITENKMITNDAIALKEAYT